MKIFVPTLFSLAIFGFTSLLQADYKVYTGDSQRTWQEDGDRIEPNREVLLLKNFIALAHPELDRFPELSTGPIDASETLMKLAGEIPYIIKHNDLGLNTKVFLGTVGGEDGRWVYKNAEFFHPTKNPTGIAVNFTEKFIQVLDLIDYLKTDYLAQNRNTIEGMDYDLDRVVKGLELYMLGIFAHESRHAIDYKQNPTRDLSMLGRQAEWKEWDGIIPDDAIEEVRTIVEVFELSGFHLNYLYYVGAEKELLYCSKFMEAMREHPQHKGKFQSKGFGGGQHNFSLLAKAERNDFPSYYLAFDAEVAVKVAAGNGSFSFDMVDETVGAYMYGQFEPSLALNELKKLNDNLEKGTLSKSDGKSIYKDIEEKWSLYMNPEGNSDAQAAHTPLAKVAERWVTENSRFQKLTSQ